MKAFALLLPVLVLAACNDHQKAPDDTPIGSRPTSTPTVAATPQAGQTVLAGTIAVVDELKDKIPANATLFIVARAKGIAGPPVLVKKVSGVTYPYTFELKSDDVMMQGAPIPEELDVTARVDQDGDAMTRTPGDLVGKTENGVARMTNGVVLTIKEAIPAQ